jgi:hypothetical protein
MTGPAAFVAEYPEVSDAVRYFGFAPSEAARKVYELSRRHSTEVYDVLSSALANCSGGVVRRTYPANSLLGIAGGRSPRREGTSQPAAVATNGHAEKTNQLTLDHELFEPSLGDRACPLGNTNEFALLVRLNQRLGT